MQGIDLRATLVPVLMADAAGQAEQGNEETLELAIALNLAADIADKPAEPDAQEAQHPPGSLELVGMAIVLFGVQM